MKKLNKYVTEIKSDYIDGEKLDTEITIEAKITISGEETERFARKIENIIDEYRI